VPHKIF